MQSQDVFQPPKGYLSDKLFSLIAITIIIIIAFSIYSNTFNASFHFDDFDNIVNVPTIRNLRNIKDIFFHSFTSRPLTNYSFALNYSLGKLNVFGFHLGNIILHTLCGILVFLFLKLTLNLGVLKDRYSLNSRWIAFFGALIFVCHPVKVEAVTYITARSELLSSLFYLSGLVFFATSVYKPQQEKFFQNLAIASSLLGMATKEILVTLPLMVLMYDYFFVSDMHIEQLKQRKRFHLLMWSTIILLIFLLSTHKNWTAAGFGNPSLPSPLQYLFTEFRVFIYYLKLIFLPLPANLNFDTYFPVSKVFFEPRTFFSFLAFIAIMLYALGNLKRKPLVSFFIFWFFIILIPSSSILPLEDVMYERRLYLPSLGWIMLFLLAMEKIKYRVRFTILAVLVLALSFWAYQRNIVWKDEFSLWHDAIKKSPLKSRTHVNLGFLYLQSGQIDKAEEYMREAISHDPDCANAYLDLALIYLLRENYDEAIVRFKEVLKRWPDYAAAYSNLGIAYRKKGLLEEAESEFKEALRISPLFGEARANLALIYVQKGRYKEAMVELKQACRLNPDIPEPHITMGLIYQAVGDLKKAIEEFRLAVSLNLRYPLAHYNLGESYFRAGQIEEAKKELLILERLNPNLAGKLKSKIEPIESPTNVTPTAGDTNTKSLLKKQKVRP